MKKVELVSAGRIIRSEGKNGTLKIKLYHKSSGKPFFNKIYLEIEGELRGFEVEDFSIVRNSPFMKLKGIDSLEKAEALRGREILVRPEDFPALEEGIYYDFQLLGCRVVTVNGREVGEVTGLLDFGGNNLLVVRSGSREIEIPLVEAICRQIDPAAKRIVIDPPEGLLELNEI
ncbi:MAG: ribosome maturation factor RimM [Candidatus Saccharicenans sp.]